ncbi:MAG: LytTR family DNA-binding domain-containing protein [Bacteroidales bacterium]|jgi:DNA-binding LytR/AlgR family response regulator|nr:LytTR family DNA-binding domain-containing protein [Bacteroidales bacterium]
MIKNFNINLPSKKGKVAANLNQILYFESMRGIDYMVLLNEEKIELTMNITEIEQILWSQGFFRVSKNYLINLRMIQVIFPDDIPMIMLENGKRLFVPGSRQKALFKALESVYQLENTLY